MSFQTKELSYRAGQSHIKIGHLGWLVGVSYRYIGDFLTHQRVLAQLGSTRRRSVNGVYLRLIIVDIRYFNGNKRGRFLRHVTVILGNNDKLVLVFRLEVEALVDGEKTTESVNGKEFLIVRLPTVDGIGDVAVRS